MRLLFLPAVVVLVAGCGGGGKHVSFTNANFATLIAHPAQYAGSRVDVRGQVASVAENDQGGTWLLLYADAKHASQVTLVDAENITVTATARQLVRVTGVVKQGLTVPFDLGGYETAPVVLADTVSPAGS